MEGTLMPGEGESHEKHTVAVSIPCRNAISMASHAYITVNRWTHMAVRGRQWIMKIKMMEGRLW